MKNLEAKGYRFLKEFNSLQQAKQQAKQYRKRQYFARVVTLTSTVRGYHTYGLYIKTKEVA